MMRFVTLASALAWSALPAAAQDFNLFPADQQPSLEELRKDPDTKILVPSKDGFREVPLFDLDSLPDSGIMVPMTNPVVRNMVPAPPIPVSPLPLEPPPLDREEG